MERLVGEMATDGATRCEGAAKTRAKVVTKPLVGVRVPVQSQVRQTYVGRIVCRVGYGRSDLRTAAYAELPGESGRRPDRSISGRRGTAWVTLSVAALQARDQLNEQSRTSAQRLPVVGADCRPQ